MAHVIAVAGKGGVGKTTLCGMLIQYLCEKEKRTCTGGRCRCQFKSERGSWRRSRYNSWRCT